MGEVVTEPKPRIEDYPDTPHGLHNWAQEMSWWNLRHGIKSKDLVKQWNEERKNAR